MWYFFIQAEDGIRDAKESRGLGDVYKRQGGLNTIDYLDEAEEIADKLKNLVKAGSHNFVYNHNYFKEQNNQENDEEVTEESEAF